MCNLNFCVGDNVALKRLHGLLFSSNMPRCNRVNLRISHLHRSRTVTMYNEWRRCAIRIIVDRIAGLLWLISCRCARERPSHDFYSAARLLFARIFKARRCVTAIDHFVRRNAYLTGSLSAALAVTPFPENNARFLFRTPRYGVFFFLSLSLTDNAFAIIIEVSWGQI